MTGQYVINFQPSETSSYASASKKSMLPVIHEESDETEHDDHHEIPNPMPNPKSLLNAPNMKETTIFTSLENCAVRSGKSPDSVRNDFFDSPRYFVRQSQYSKSNPPILPLNTFKVDSQILVPSVDFSLTTNNPHEMSLNSAGFCMKLPYQDNMLKFTNGPFIISPTQSETTTPRESLTVSSPTSSLNDQSTSFVDFLEFESNTDSSTYFATNGLSKSSTAKTATSSCKESQNVVLAQQNNAESLLEGEDDDIESSLEISHCHSLDHSITSKKDSSNILTKVRVFLSNMTSKMSST